MSFFEPPPPRPERAHPPPPPWFGPPADELAVVLPIERMLARTESVAVSVRSLAVHGNGFSVGLAVRVKAGPDTDPVDSAHAHLLIQAGGDVPDEFLRFGVEFADGSKATNLEEFPPWDEPPEPPVLVGHGESYWIWPLPPPGPLGLLCEWPAEGISLSRLDIDPSRILDAAARVRSIWD